MKHRRLYTLLFAVGLATLALAGPVTASTPSCAGQFASTVAPLAVPFGQLVVVPEVRNLTFGGPNLGQEVKVLLATADRNACPVAP